MHRNSHVSGANFRLERSSRTTRFCYRKPRLSTELRCQLVYILKRAICCTLGAIACIGASSKAFGLVGRGCREGLIGLQRGGPATPPAWESNAAPHPITLGEMKASKQHA